MDVAALLTLDSFFALLTLTALEIVLGIDNIIFIAVLTGRLPANRQTSARNVGLGLAMLMRIVLLFALFWVMQLTAPIFEVPFLSWWVGDGATTEASLAVSGRDLILIIGGLFLLGKATVEIHHLVESGDGPSSSSGETTSVGAVLTQIVLLDIVFSLDSVITAVGMVDRIEVMVAAVIIAVGVMITFGRCREPICPASPIHEDVGAVVPRDESASSSWPTGWASTFPEGTCISRWRSA